MEIINPDNIPAAVIAEEIADVERLKNRHVSKAEFHRVDRDTVSEKFWFYPVNFERIRRITGYLVGTLDHFNDGKRAEERDRVKHE